MTGVVLDYQTFPSSRDVLEKLVMNLLRTWSPLLYYTVYTIINARGDVERLKVHGVGENRNNQYRYYSEYCVVRLARFIQGDVAFCIGKCCLLINFVVWSFAHCFVMEKRCNCNLTSFFERRLMEFNILFV